MSLFIILKLLALTYSMLWSIELIMHWFCSRCTDLWMHWTYFSGPLKVHNIQNRLCLDCVGVTQLLSRNHKMHKDQGVHLCNRSSAMTIINGCHVSQQVWHAEEPSMLNGHECRAYVKICDGSQWVKGGRKKHQETNKQTNKQIAGWVSGSSALTPLFGLFG